MSSIARTQKKVWSICRPSSLAQSLAEQLRIRPLTAQVLVNRDLSCVESARSFLSPKLTDLIEPGRMPGVEAAVERILKALSGKEKIAIYGDYDVDGITGVAILWHLLRMLGAKVEYYIPHRIDEGYGLNSEAVGQLGQSGVSLVITVDCGISAVAEVEHAAKAGMDVIITDHHQPGPTLPEAVAIVHPLLRPDYPNPHSSGAMVAFKLAWAIANTTKGTGPLGPQLREYLLNATTLAAMGTIADVVDLRGENRILTGYGLKGLSLCRQIGIRAISDAAELNAAADPNSYDVAFKLAPMLNAAGRMGHARLAVELLTTDNPLRAMHIAAYLKEQNKLRQKCQSQILRHARELIGRSGLAHPDRRSIVIADESWHSGVIGVVASRIIEQFYRPTLLIAINNGAGHGSGRSIPGFDLYAGLAACSEYLTSFGGHEMAAGFRIETANIQPFAEAFEQYARRTLRDEVPQQSLQIEALVGICDIDQKLLRELSTLEPFGQGNPRPIFATRAVRLISPPRRVGRTNDHLQLSIADNTGTAVRCVGFGMGHLEKKLIEAETFDIAYQPQQDNYNGRNGVQLVLADIQFE